MNPFRIEPLVLYVAASVLALGGCAQTQNPASMKAPAFRELTIPDLWQARTMANTTPLPSTSCAYKDSKNKDQCRVTVEMSVAGDVCTANVKGFLTVPKKKTPNIVWTIDRTTDASALNQDFEFPERYGIIVVDDPDDQINSRNNPGKGGWGNGDDDTTTRTLFFWDNKNKKAAHAKIAHIYYLPAVQWKKVESNGTINLMLCRAIDPRIVNEGD